MVAPSQRRSGVKCVVEKGLCSERRACRLVGVSRSGVRYRPRPHPERERLIKRIRKLAARHKRYGYRRIRALLLREGSAISRGKMERLWKREGLGLPGRRPRRRRSGPRAETIHRATHKDHVWSYDFLEDRTERGGRLRILVVLDEHTRELLTVYTAPSISSARVQEVLEWLFLTRGVPTYLRSDNGPEFVAQALQRWLEESGCQTIHIAPGSPWENPYIESFNGKFRDECLNREIFRNGAEARLIMEAWREEYNQRRPHSALGYLTPSEFAAKPPVDCAGPAAPEEKPCRGFPSRLDNSPSCPQALGELRRSSPHTPQAQHNNPKPLIANGPKKRG